MALIGFSGAGGTGKTTVANYLGSNIPSIVDYLRKEFYGQSSKFNQLDNFDEILRFQYGILYAQVGLEKILPDLFDNDIIPIERSTIDYAAYLLHQSDRFELTNSQIIDIKRYVEKCIDHANKYYDGIVYFPTGQFTPADAEGSSKERDEESIKKTDTYINNLLEHLSIPTIRLRSSRIESRAKAVTDFYDWCQRNKDSGHTLDL